jgi:hypothetical protein
MGIYNAISQPNFLTYFPKDAILLFTRTSGRSSIGRTSPCQGEGYEFEPRRPLFFSRQGFKQMATWPSGKAWVCKTLITGSNPVVASQYKKAVSSRGFGDNRSRRNP